MELRFWGGGGEGLAERGCGGVVFYSVEGSGKGRRAFCALMVGGFYMKGISVTILMDFVKKGLVGE